MSFDLFVCWCTVGRVEASSGNMKLFIVLFMSLVKDSLLLTVDIPDSILYRGREVRQLHPAEVWKRYDGDWAPVAGLLDSAAGRRSSWMRAYQLLRMLRSRQVHGSGSRSPEPTRTWHRSNVHAIRVPTKDRGRGLLKLTTISRPETVPDSDSSFDVGDMFVADEANNRWKKWKKSPHFEDEATRKMFAEVRRSPLAHPIYLGLGQDAVDEAYRTYINIISPSTRNSRKASTNPVDFVGRRWAPIYRIVESWFPDTSRFCTVLPANSKASNENKKKVGAEYRHDMRPSVQLSSVSGVDS